MNGFELDRKPPTSVIRAPDKPRTASQPNKVQAGDHESRNADFASLRVRSEDESTAAVGRQTAQGTGAPGSSAAPVAAPKPPGGPPALRATLDRFEHNRANLTAAHRSSLRALAASIATRLALAPGSRALVVVTGHTDTSGDERHNDALGQKRAEAAQAALERELAPWQLGADRIAPIVTESRGETEPAIPTGDGVKEPANRRVEIAVTIEGPALSTPPLQTHRQPPPDLRLPPDYWQRLPPEDWWKRTEREREQIAKGPQPRAPKSPRGALVDAVTGALEPLIRRLPKVLQEPARDGIRKGIEKGTEAACDAAVDASGVTGDQAAAIKAACKAALETTPEAKR